MIPRRSGTIAIGAGRKEVTFTVTNISDKALAKPVLYINQESYDPEQVRFPFNDKVCRTGLIYTMDCPLSPDPLPPGRSAKVTLDLTVQDDATPGSAGTLEVLVGHRAKGATTEYFKFPLTVSPAQGPDLFVRAGDVPAGGTLEPGKGARAGYVFGNHGDVPAKNIHVRITLPRGAKLDKALMGGDVPAFAHCTAADQSATCEFPDDVLAPHAARRAYFPIVLNADAERGVNLTGQVEIIHSEVATAADLLLLLVGRRRSATSEK